MKLRAAAQPTRGGEAEDPGTDDVVDCDPDVEAAESAVPAALGHRAPSVA